MQERYPGVNLEEEREALTSREREILSYLAQACTHKEIAVHLHISPDTVKKHLWNIYRKLRVNNRIDALKKLSLL